MSMKTVVEVAKLTFELTLGYRLGRNAADVVMNLSAYAVEKAKKKLYDLYDEETRKDLESGDAKLQAILMGQWDEPTQKSVKNKAPIGFR